MVDEWDDVPKKAHWLKATDLEEREAVLMYLLAGAVDKLGGSFVLTKEELWERRIRIVFDAQFEKKTGGIRVFAYPDPEEETDEGNHPAGP